MKRRKVWIGIAVAVAVMLVIAVPLALWFWGGGLAGHGFWSMRGDRLPFGSHSWRAMPMGHIGIWGSGLLRFLGLLLLAGLVWLIVRGWHRQDTLQGAEDQRNDGPLELLKLRLVNGEITPEEYESIKGKLLS